MNWRTSGRGISNEVRIENSKIATPEQSIENLDKVRTIILDNQNRLFMGHWHDDYSEWQAHTCAEEAACETTHCLAGWLQVCSTDPEVRKMEPQTAGFMCAPIACSMFFQSDDRVLKWLENREYVKALEERKAQS